MMPPVAHRRYRVRLASCGMITVAEVTVEFEAGVGVRRLLPSFALLEKVWAVVGLALQVRDSARHSTIG